MGALPAPEHELPMALPQPEARLEHEALHGHSQLALAVPSASNLQLALAHTGAAASTTALALQASSSGKKKKKGIMNFALGSAPSLDEQLAQMRDEAGMSQHGYDSREFLDE